MGPKMIGQPIASKSPMIVARSIYRTFLMDTHAPAPPQASASPPIFIGSIALPLEMCNKFRPSLAPAQATARF